MDKGLSIAGSGFHQITPADADPDRTPAPSPNPMNRPLQGPSTAVGVFTRSNNLRSRHATAGKLVNRVSSDAQLRSLTLAGACPISSRTGACPISSRTGARPSSSLSKPSPSCTPFHHAQFAPSTPKPRSIPTRFVFADVRASAIHGESGEGSMGKMKFAKIAERVCAPANELRSSSLRVPNKKRFWDAVVVDGVYGETFGQ